MDELRNAVVQDEIVCAADLVRKVKFTEKQKDFFITNHSLFGDFTFRAFDKAKKDGVFYVADAEEKYDKVVDPLGILEKSKVISEKNVAVLGGTFYFFVDCRDPLYQHEEKKEKILRQLKKWLLITSNTEKCKLLLLALIKTPDPLPPGITSIAEREYDCYLAHKELDWSEKFYLDLENCCREMISKKNAKGSILRFDNIFGPGIDLMDCFSIKNFINTAFSCEKVEISCKDAREHISGTYIRDAVQAVAVGACSAKNANIYNVAGYQFSLKKFKLVFQGEFEERLALSLDLDKVMQMHFHALNCLKIQKLGFMTSVRLAEAVYRTGTYYGNLEYDMNRQLEIYCGRLEMIKAMERDMLKFVDRVCRENDIQYFLAGGSLLGAVRHNSAIPWDDDLDIGMLRKDFEKFRRICPGLMPEKYTYESPRDGRESHYCLDKVRIRNTFFSTDYSGNFEMQDGVFLDVIVYDQTSNFKLKANLQIYLIRIWTWLISIKWYNKPRRNSHYRFTQLFLPLIRVIPFPFIHTMFERVLRRYEKKANAAYLIDGVGQNIRKGRFPKKWLSDVIYVKFDDMQAPIPIGYDDYLRHFYGPQYMELLPISKRVSGHKFARIDLGEYLYRDGTFRDVSIAGELFERPLHV